MVHWFITAKRTPKMKKCSFQCGKNGNKSFGNFKKMLDKPHKVCYNKYNKTKKEVDTMMKISEMIAMLAEVMADHGDKEVVFVNDETGEIRYAMGMTVMGDEVAIDHISYGEK